MKYRLIEMVVNGTVELDEGMIPIGCVYKRILGEWAISGPDVTVIHVLEPADEEAP